MGIPVRRVILVAVAAAVVVILAAKVGKKDQSPDEPARESEGASQDNSRGLPILYLFHDPSDQDAGCRRIYAFADRAERELAGKMEVRRPDVTLAKDLVARLQVRLLPSIVVVSPSGRVEERFEGEDEETAEHIRQCLERLKGTRP